MASFEQVEKLRERANVTYDEAKAALDACNDDLLEAMILLEKEGKVVPPVGGGFYSTKSRPHSGQGATGTLPGDTAPGETFGDLMRRFFRWCGNVLHRGNTNQFQVIRKERLLITLPVTVLILLLVFCFWVSIPLLIIGLFCGCRYRFQGPELDKTGVNSVMDNVAAAADSIKSEIVHMGDPARGDDDNDRQ